MFNEARAKRAALQTADVNAFIMAKTSWSWFQLENMVLHATTDNTIKEFNGRVGEMCIRHQDLEKRFRDRKRLEMNFRGRALAWPVIVKELLSLEPTHAHWARLEPDLASKPVFSKLEISMTLLIIGEHSVQLKISGRLS